MDLAELKRKGLIKPIPVDKIQIRELIEISERDLVLAEDILPRSFDGSLNLSYNSMLQAARAFMLSYGFRPDSEQHHLATIEFVGAVLDKKYFPLVESINRVRSKRVVATYERAGSISKFEAEYALEKANEFLKLVKSKLI